MEERKNTANKKSTPVENKQVDIKNHVNQSTGKKSSGKQGVIILIIIVVLVILGLLFFSESLTGQ